MSERLYVAQVVTGWEEQWFAPGTDAPPVKVQRGYLIQQHLFTAKDAHDAYRIVSGWLENNAYTDSNHDGDGDLTRYFGIGIHQLEEVTFLDDFSSALRDLYGINLPQINLADVDENGVPLVRAKDELEVFRLLRLLGPDGLPPPKIV